MARRLSLLLAALILPVSLAGAQDARSAVEAFVGRLAGAQVQDLKIEQTFTVFHPDGRFSQSTGTQRVWVKVPRQQRVEQIVEGKREIRLSTDGRVWVRTAEGRVHEAPRDPERDRTHMIMPFQSRGDDLLAEWRRLGIRDEVAYDTRVGTRTVTVIGAKPGERDVPAVWLDPEYGVVRFVRRERLRKSEIMVDLAFSEHRPLPNGFYFPYRQEAFANARLILLVVVHSVAINSNLPDELFDPDALRRGK